MKKFILFVSIICFISSCGGGGTTSGTGKLRITNHSLTRNIIEVYITSNTNSQWGENRITAPILNSTDYNGDTVNDYEDFILTQGVYDIKVKDSDDDFHTLEDITIGDFKELHYTYNTALETGSLSQ